MSEIVEGWRVILSHQGISSRLVGASVLNVSVTLLMIHFSFTAFEAGLSLLESLILSTYFMISSMIPLTPSGLGVAELAVVIASRDFTETSSVSILSVGLTRSAMVLSSLAWGSLSSWVLSKRVIPTSNTKGDKGPWRF